MTSIPYWIQRADLTADDFPAVDEQGAIEAFEGVDWQRELARQTGDAESCDPGIGFVPGDGRILHICPQADGLVYLHYHYVDESESRDFFRSTKQRTRTKRSVPHSEVPGYISRFFKDDHDWLLGKTEAA